MRTFTLQILTIFTASLLLGGCSKPPSGGFKSPEEASRALLSAARAGDDQALDQLFGQGFVDYIRSEDSVSDRYGLEQLALNIEQGTEVTTRSDGARVLQFGNRHTPFPVPLVKQDRWWFFDSTEGAEEIISRRIGDNEIRAIKVAEFFVDAQKLYFSKDRDGDGVRQYAKHFVSSPGKRDGLFWSRTVSAPEPSPFGPLMGVALAQGYDLKERAQLSTEPGTRMLRGYHYRILFAQDGHAPGGKKSYLNSKNQLTKGFALIAYPVEWGNTGIMTFIVGPDGKVFEKDLGPDTKKIAAEVDKFNPDPSWQAARG